MKLFLKGIGKIQEAVVEINGITIIAGENNTGKSTVGKALYSIFNSFYEIDKYIRMERVQSIESILGILMYHDKIISLNSRPDTERIAQYIVERSINYKYDNENLSEEIVNSIFQYDESFKNYYENSNLEESIQRILDVLQVSDEDVFKTVLNKKLQVEFNGQINNIYMDKIGKIDLQIKDQVVSIEVLDNVVTSIDNRVNIRTDIVYLDDPFVLDEQETVAYLGFLSSYVNHKTHLRNKLFKNGKDTNIINEIVATNKFKKIYEKINTICSGDIVNKSRGDFGYRKGNTDKMLDIKNISAGLKTFIILKKLLINGTIETNGTIILDEPEIHLHPQWQLLFAEIIVLIQKEFGMHILLNTHSPYFLRAIQVYSAKYEIADKCKYYLSMLNEDEAIISDVTSEIDKIYKKLSYPLQQLEDERWQDD